MTLVDTADALDLTKSLGLNAVLMINDYDEGRTLAEHHPAGGVVSLAELADVLLLIEQRAGLRESKPMPHKPFELFEPRLNAGAPSGKVGTGFRKRACANNRI